MPIATTSMKRTPRAFTLIELLVVIAIIGILSSVVLAAVNYARTKGRDAAVKANIEAVFTQAAIYTDTNNGYGDTAGVSDCTVGLYSDPTVTSALSSISAVNGAAAPNCYAGVTTYAVAVTRPTDARYTPDSVYWCADSTGKKCGIDDLAALPGGTCGCP